MSIYTKILTRIIGLGALAAALPVSNANAFVYPGWLASYEEPVAGKFKPIAGLETVGGGGDIKATYIGENAGGINIVSLIGRPGPLFINQGPQGTPIGTTVDLGQFASGQELEFQMVNATEGLTFYSGPGWRNIDGHVHALVTTNIGDIIARGYGDDQLSPVSLALAYHMPAGTLFIGFKDVTDFYNQDHDYNDIVFAIYGDPPHIYAPIPEPAIWVMMIAGFTLTFWRLRRGQKRPFAA